MKSAEQPAQRRGRLMWLASSGVVALCLGQSAADNNKGQGASATAVTDTAEWSELERTRIFSHSPLPPMPPSSTNRVADDPDAAHFGQYLFYDTRLSVNNEVSCATCHEAKFGLSNGRILGVGVGTTPRHSVALWNLGYDRWYNWDGAKDSVWSQALGPLEAPLEMGNNRLAIARLIASDSQLRQAYVGIFGELPPLNDRRRFPDNAKPSDEPAERAMNEAWKNMSEADRHAVNTVFANLGKAIEAYQRKLVSTDAPFDVFVEALRNGDLEGMNVLSEEATRGLRLFVSDDVHCRSCHVGPNFSDSEFHSLSMLERGGKRPRDAGRFEGVGKLKDNPFNAAGRYSDDPDGKQAKALLGVIHSPEAWGQFKTPTLRSVALSPPYMHQGQVRDLAAVINFYSTLETMVPMGHHQENILVPLNLTEMQASDLEAFLHALTGAPIDASLLQQPADPRRIDH